jgi:hypothetical protein
VQQRIMQHIDVHLQDTHFVSDADYHAIMQMGVTGNGASNPASTRLHCQKTSCSLSCPGALPCRRLLCIASQLLSNKHNAWCRLWLLLLQCVLLLWLVTHLPAEGAALELVQLDGLHRPLEGAHLAAI